MESLLALRDRPLFAHLARLESPWPRTPGSLSRQPGSSAARPAGRAGGGHFAARAQGEAGFALQPVGTGPYRVIANDPLQLRLAAFDDYFGLRALLDEIDIWMLPELAERLESHLQLGRDSPSLAPCAASRSSNRAATSCCRTSAPAPCRILLCATGSFSCSVRWP